MLRFKLSTRAFLILLWSVAALSGGSGFLTRLRQRGDSLSKSPQSPLERLEYLRMRNGLKPGESESLEELFRAKEHLDRMHELQYGSEEAKAKQDKDAGIWNWEWLGSGNVGGRVRALTIHPTSTSTMWVAGVSGGIWKSTNSGVWWNLVDDFRAVGARTQSLSGRLRSPRAAMIPEGQLHRISDSPPSGPSGA